MVKKKKILKTVLCPHKRLNKLFSVGQPTVAADKSRHGGRLYLHDEVSFEYLALHSLASDPLCAQISKFAKLYCPKEIR